MFLLTFYSFFFFISIFIHIFLNRHHRRDKHFGPSPSNGYTSGRGRGARFWRSKKKNAAAAHAADDKFQTQHPLPQDVYYKA